MKAKGGDIEKYIQEGLLALLPFYQEGAGKTIVFTVDGSYADPRGAPWLVEKLASYCSVNLPELRRRCGKLLELKHYISLPLSENIVLLPVKVRQSAKPGETTTGFINLRQVQEILPPVLCAPGKPTLPPVQNAPGKPTFPPAQSAPGQPRPQFTSGKPILQRSQPAFGHSTRLRPHTACSNGPGHLGTAHPKPAQPIPGQPDSKAISSGQPQPQPQPQPLHAPSELHSPAGLLFPEQERPGPLSPGRHPFASVSNNPAWLSRVLFKCGLQLKTLNTPGTLRERLRQGEILLQDFLRRRRQGLAFAGLTRRALLEQLPNCDCVLKDIFIDMLGLKADK